jgi:hypothetical protein
MHSYWTWFDVDVASGLNAHIRYLAESLEDYSCLFLRYLNKPVEIPVYKRCFKTKPTVVSPLIRTSDVGREELQKVRETLESEGFPLKLRRSPKRRFLNQVSAPIPVDDPLFPLKVRSILTTVAEALGEKMPDRVVVGYHQNAFGEPLPGEFHYNSKAPQIAYNLGKKLGSKMRNG